MRNKRNIGMLLSQTARRILGATAVAALAYCGTAFAAGVEIPSTFESVPLLSSDLDDFVPRCMPSTKASDVRDAAQKAGEHVTVTRRGPDQTKPYLVTVDGSVICVKVSDKKYPILPLSVFNNTVNFAGMDPEESKKLYTDLAQQIAMRGFGVARVLNDSGNAVDLVYLLNSEAPQRIYYRGSFIKKDDLAAMPLPLGATAYNATGGMTVTSRGQPPEGFKSLFQK